MRNLIDFLIKYNHWLLFFFLEAISLVLLFRFNSYQGSVFFTSANRVVSGVYAAASSASSYFGLRDTNEKLLDRNTYLEAEVVALRHRLDSLHASALFSPDDFYRAITARVIKNSVNLDDNYLLLDKGSKEGIAPDMGIIGTDGVAGIVYMVSEHRAIGISVLNSKASISCKVAGSGYFGNLRWEGGDSRHAFLYDVPDHADVAKGDTIITSGFSTVFPEGIPVGRIEEVKYNKDGLSYVLKVALGTNFANISNVRVVQGKFSDEQSRLENETKAEQHESKHH